MTIDETYAFLALFLDAPLQAWGYKSRFDRRASLSFPTRSGVTGLICAAMGIKRDDRDFLSGFSNVRMKTFTYLQNGRLIDFHTVGGGFDPKTERLNMVRKANNTLPATVVTRREYLQHSRFGVILSGEKQFLQKVAKALSDPVWGLWLGRKACIPAAPICQGLYEDEKSAVNRLEQLAAPAGLQRKVEETGSFEEGSDTIQDVPVDFSQRDFAPRRIKTTEYT